jgi:hypothetical protein
MLKHPAAPPRCLLIFARRLLGFGWTTSAFSWSYRNASGMGQAHCGTLDTQQAEFDATKPRVGRRSMHVRASFNTTRKT